MGDTIYFHLPDYVGHQNLNLMLINFMKNNPDFFYDDIKIGSVYGTFTGAIWNGGRIMSGPTNDIGFITQTYKLFNDLGVPLRHTFTNTVLEDTDVYDRYCNIIMEKGDNGLNQVLINSPILEDYIRKKYPNYPIISSTTKRILTYEDLEAEMDKDYKLIVLDYALNKNPQTYMIKNKEKIEILINAYCCDNCPRRSDHYRYMSEMQRNLCDTSKCDDGGNNAFMCNYIADDFYTAVMTRQSSLKVEEIYMFYKQLGFRHFKIEGRTSNPADVLESYIYYLVKPEFRDHIRLQFWRNIMMPQGPIIPAHIQLSPDDMKDFVEYRDKIGKPLDIPQYVRDQMFAEKKADQAPSEAPQESK